MQDTGWLKLNAGCQIPDAGYRMPDTRYRIPDAGYLILITDYWIRDLAKPI